MQDTKTISGSILHITDAANTDARSITVDIEATQDLNGYDKPWSGGAGKNILHITATSQTVVGVQITVNDDGSFTLNGTATSSTGVSLGTVSLVANQSYILNGSTGGSGTTYRLNGYNGNTVVIQSVNGDSATYTPTENVTLTVRIYFNSGTSFSNKKFYPMLRLASVSDATFEPYSNICPISGTDSVGVYVTGKNLFDKDAVSSGKWLSTTTGLEESASNYCVSDYIPVQAGQTVFIAESNSARRWFYDTNRTPKTYLSNSGNQAYTPNENGYIRVSILVNGANAIDLDTYQIEYGSSATAYEPFGHTTTTALNQTVYGGSLDVVSGTLTVTHGIVDLGTLAWIDYSGSAYLTFGSYSLASELVFVQSRPTIICSQYEARSYNTASSSADGYVWINANKLICLKDTSKANMTPADFKTAMSGVQLVYELATPQTVTLSAAAVELLKECYVWSSAGDVTLVYETYLINGIFHKVKINGISILGPNDFTLERSDVYAAEITTCTGKTIADRIGWKYADMDLNWDYLPQDQLEILLNLSGVFSLTFENEEGDQFTEQCIKRNSVMTGTRFTADDGTAVWKNVQFGISFINVH